MKTIIAILIMATCLGCSSENNDDINSYVMEGSIDFSIKDTEGNDLLNPNNKGAFKENEIKLFYLNDNVVEEVYNQNRDYKRGFHLFKIDSGYRISVGLNSAETEEFPITYVQWDETDTDTLKGEFKRTPNGTFLKKVWLNDQLIWDAINETELHYVLIK